MGLLDGLAQTIFSGFQGKLLTGRLRRLEEVPSAGLDELGDELATDPVFYPFEGFVDEFSAFSKFASGIPASALKVCIFGASMTVVPVDDDIVELPTDSGVWYQLKAVSTDPADALWTCQAFVRDDPDAS